MAATKTEVVEPQSEEEALTLEEFCTRLSMTDRRVELIGGWHSDEQRSGVVKDTESAFRARFVAFATKPV